MVDITGLDKVELLKRLWLNVKPEVTFNKYKDVLIPRFDDPELNRLLKKYIYTNCEPTETDKILEMGVAGDFVNPTIYNQHLSKSEKTLEEIVNEMKEKSTKT